MQKNSRLQDASLVLLFGKTIGFFCLARSTTDCKERRRVFLHTFLLENEAQTCGKKYRAVTFYEIGDHMQKFSSFGRKKKKQTKIQHRMVMLEDLQL